MTLRPRTLASAGVILFTAAALALLAASRVEYRVNLGSVIAIWGDFVRDIDQVGLTFTRISIDKEMEIGEGIAAGFSTWTAHDLRVRYLTEVGQRMVTHVQRPGMRYQFHVLKRIWPNAYAIPGGHVYVTTAMLEFVQNEAELAAVIGHEIAHVDLRHCIERLQYEQAARKLAGEDLAGLVRLGHEFLRFGFNEQQELEADAAGLLLAAKAGYDPGAALTFFTRMSDRERTAGRDKPRTMTGEAGRAVIDALIEYFDTHPPGETRTRQLMAVYRKNASLWEGKRFYVGRSNLQDRQSRATSERDSEWAQFQMPVALERSVGKEPVRIEEASDPVETSQPKATGATLRLGTDKHICQGTLYGNPDYIREAERRGLTEEDCRRLTGTTPPTGKNARSIVPLDEMRTMQATSVRVAPHDDAPLLGYVGGTVRVTGWFPTTGWYRIVWAENVTGFVSGQALDVFSKFQNFAEADLCRGVSRGNPDYIREAERRGLTEQDCRALVDGDFAAKNSTASGTDTDGQWTGKMTCGSCPHCPGPLEKNVSITIESGRFDLAPDESYVGRGQVSANGSVRVWRHETAAYNSELFSFEGRLFGDNIELSGKRGPRQCLISLHRLE